ncbi:unnamed protein product [Paramecium octaurelia]|uniref:Vacuolar protein sorting-associated protein 16 homolog n=1 Tax=Paramecium octaurelia TaxID=43137 RepID=A0A8S1T7Q1_PAROT|nr:unnamed protein product [Paramecium octaurelia]
MDPSTQWKELNKKYYKFHQFNPITGEQKFLDFYYQHIAVAKWGGPLAATKNFDQVILMRTDDILKDSIVFFTNSGKIMSRTPYKEADKIPLFDFLEDEHLILLKASGVYYIIDPFKGTKKNHDLGEQFKLNQIQSALIVNNGFVLMAMNFEFYYVQNAHEPEVQQFKPSNLTQFPEHWLVIPSDKSSSGKVELLIANPDGGILHIIENEKWKIYYNKDKITTEIDKKLPDLRNIKMLSLSPTYKNLALLQYYGQRWIMAFITNYFESSEYRQMPIDLKEDDVKKDETAEKDLSILERPRKMFWCGDDCVVLQLQQYIVLVSQDSYTKIKMNNQHFAMKSEYDGLRVLTQKKNEILRKLPDSYINVFEQLSVKPGAQLYCAYESFEQKNPIEDDELRNSKSLLSEAVSDCVRCAQFEINPEYQIKLLKSGNYGKIFLGTQNLDPNIFNETARYLRVVNSLRRSGGVGGRVVTYEQVLQLIKIPDIMIGLLLRYNLHYLAVEVSNFLKFQIKQRASIYTHWACRKVEVQEDDDVLCEIIKEKIKEERGVSFTQIAQKSIEIGKQQLALKLLDNEQSLSKRIPVLIWMANFQSSNNNNSYYEKALADAIISKDSNLIFFVIMKFLKTEMNETYKFSTLSQNPISQTLLVYYLRNFDDKYLQKYLQYYKKFDECGLLAINQAYQQNNLDEKIKFLDQALKYFAEDETDQFYKRIIAEQIIILKDLKSEVEKGRKKPNQAIMEEKPINSIMEAFFVKDKPDFAHEFAKTYKIPDRRIYLTRVKTLINKKNWDELDKFMQEKNKKSIIIPYELVSELLFKADQEERGISILMKMPDVEESCRTLIRIGQQTSAVQVAINNKKTQLLYDIRGLIFDNSAKALLETYLSQNQK